MKKLGLLILALGSISLYSCGSSSTSDIEGTWSSSCTGSGSTYSKAGIKITSTTFTQTSTVYSDSSCSTATYSSSSSLSYTVGGAVSSPSGAKKIDSTYIKVTYTPANSSAASSFNSSAVCGSTDWAQSVEKDVTGKTCGTTSIPSAGTKHYSIYKLDTSSTPSTLTFGTNSSSSDDGTTDEKRNSILGTTVYSKQ